MQSEGAMPLNLQDFRGPTTSPSGRNLGADNDGDMEGDVNVANQNKPDMVATVR